MNLSRRSFLKALGAASSLALVGIAPGQFDGTTYWMVEGEILSDLHTPLWAKIRMADNCVIQRCYFSGTQIILDRVDGCVIRDCILTDTKEAAIVARQTPFLPDNSGPFMLEHSVG